MGKIISFARFCEGRKDKVDTESYELPNGRRLEKTTEGLITWCDKEEKEGNVGSLYLWKELKARHTIVTQVPGAEEELSPFELRIDWEFQYGWDPHERRKLAVRPSETCGHEGITLCGRLDKEGSCSDNMVACIKFIDRAYSDWCKNEKKREGDR